MREPQRRRQFITSAIVPAPAAVATGASATKILTTTAALCAQFTFINSPLLSPVCLPTLSKKRTQSRVGSSGKASRNPNKSDVTTPCHRCSDITNRQTDTWAYNSTLTHREMVFSFSNAQFSKTHEQTGTRWSCHYYITWHSLDQKLNQFSRMQNNRKTHRTDFSVSEKTNSYFPFSAFAHWSSAQRW